MASPYSSGFGGSTPQELLREADVRLTVAAEKAEAEIVAVRARLDQHKARLYEARSRAIDHANELAKSFGWSCYLYSNAGDVLWRGTEISRTPSGAPDHRGTLPHPDWPAVDGWSWSLPDTPSSAPTFPTSAQALAAMIEELERRQSGDATNPQEKP